MDYRTLDLTLFSATGLKNGATLFGKSDVYAVAYIYGSHTIQKLTVHKNGGSNPTWNFPMKFTVDYAAILQKRVGIVVEIKAVGIFSDKKLGEVRRPFVGEVLEDVSTERKWQTSMVASYQVRTPSGKPKGYLSFSYRFGGEFSGNVKEAVTAYPFLMAVGNSSMYATKDWYYRNPAVHQRPKKNKLRRKGSDDDFLDGAVFGCLMAGVASGCGGGCGG
ncbi:hypothetical protein L2E82_06713 [Cichorium intybus]|uniref:Uncharacterized protein n=1 Tax=Cichorium intybus TaxID=13427 RepID=A0ACB9HD11_CICIN|nr:hypothetical protein L2E82_06713 [Cichorium intybus]